VNCRITYRFGGGDPDHMANAARETMDADPDLVVVRSTPGVKALVATGRTNPIVFVSVSDPVGEGFAATMARPGGHITGFTNFEASLGGKWIELLKQAAPTTKRLLVLYNPEVAVRGGAYYLRTAEDAARSQGLEIRAIPVGVAADIEEPLRILEGERDGAIVVVPDPFIVVHRTLIIEAASRHGLAAIYPFRNMASEGGLMSYGVNLRDLYRRAAAYVDRILKGALPGELPIQAPTGFELVVNLKTAKDLGLTIPPSLLARADDVIE